MKTILVVEDDAAIASAVSARLRSEGFDVRIARDGPSAVDMHAATRPDLVVLDLLLPGFGGLEVCRRIQRHGHVPVLMLTALDDETDMVVGLSLGADDYLTKPFSQRELVARIHAILRRVDAAAAPSTSTDPPVIVIGEVSLEVSRRRVTCADGEVHLTATEFDLLAHLALATGAVMSRERLLSEIWGYRDASGARTVDSHVRSLRRKLGDGIIRTVHGVGYGIGLDDDGPGQSGTA